MEFLQIKNWRRMSSERKHSEKKRNQLRSMITIYVLIANNVFSILVLSLLWIYTIKSLCYKTFGLLISSRKSLNNSGHLKFFQSKPSLIEPLRKHIKKGFGQVISSGIYPAVHLCCLSTAAGCCYSYRRICWRSSVLDKSTQIAFRAL